MANENSTEKAYAEDELLKKVGEILTKKDDEGFLTEVVSEITDKIHELSGKIVDRDDEIKDLKEDIESLRNANMALLRKQGAKVEEKEEKKSEFVTDDEKEESDEEILEKSVADYI
jgi:hypothetical protein